MNRLNQTHDGLTIDGIVINEEIFQEEKHEYRIIHRKEEIESLCSRIIESRNESDKYLMLEDLKQLINSTDEYILSSGNTNDYIDSLDEEYNKYCDEILSINTQLGLSN